MRLDPELARAHLRLICEGAPSGFVAVNYSRGSGPPTQFEFFPVEDPDLIARRCMQLAEHGHVYVTGGIFGEPPLKGRGKAEDVVWIQVATLDFDVGVEGHKSGANLPKDRADLTRLLAAIPEIPKPCATYDTGNGLLAMWQLEEPLAIDSPADGLRAARLLGAFQDRLRAVAQDHFGWKLDRTSDLPRLLRLAGTLNWKSNPPKPVTEFA